MKSLKEGDPGKRSMMMDELLSDLIRRFDYLGSEQKLGFMKMCAENSRGQKKLLKKILSIWLKASYPRVPSKSDIWMETRLKNNMKLKPKELAIQCANYLKIPKEMIPYLIKLAQKVKQRLRMREKRRPVLN